MKRLTSSLPCVSFSLKELGPRYEGLIGSSPLQPRPSCPCTASWTRVTFYMTTLTGSLTSAAGMKAGNSASLARRGTQAFAMRIGREQTAHMLDGCRHLAVFVPWEQAGESNLGTLPALTPPRRIA